LFDLEYPDDASRRRFFDALGSHLETLPGMESFAFVSSFPALGGDRGPIEIETRTYPKEQEHPRARRVAVTPRSFELFDLALIEGRDFQSSDDHESPAVAIINKSLSDRYFADESPLGKRIRRAGRDNEPWMTIVGVAPDVMTTGSLFDEPPEGIYVPLRQNPNRYAGIAIRTQGEVLAVSSELRKAVRNLDPNLPVYGVGRLSSTISNRTWFVDVFGSLFVIFGVAALLLAGIGLYGVMSFSVSRRVSELGLRRTLGAQTLDLLTLVFKQGLNQLAMGMFIGLGLGLGLSKLVEGLLYGVGPWDPLAITLVISIMLSTGLVASIVPAYRAVRIAPAEALRYE
jgi:predicted permease